MHQLLVERSDRLDGPFVSAENREFWSAAQEVNELGGELTGRRGLSSTCATTDQRRERRDTDPAGQQADSEDQTRGSEEGCCDRDRDAAGDDGNDRRRDTEEEQVL